MKRERKDTRQYTILVDEYGMMRRRIRLSVLSILIGDEKMKKLNMALFLLAAMFAVVDPAFAMEGAEAGMSGLQAIAAGLGIAIAAAVSAFSQSRVVATALESIGRNPGAASQMFTPMILGIVFIETLVIFTFLITGKLGGFL